MSSLYSALLLTGLLAIGLFFFIKASVKERTAQLLLAVQSKDLPQKVQTHFLERGYRTVKVDAESETVTLEGRVGFSIGVLLLLTMLSGIGAGCLGLVLTILLPDLWQMQWEILAVVISMISTALFYAKGAKRTEQIKLVAKDGNQLQIIAHRDELTALKRSLNLTGDI